MAEGQSFVIVMPKQYCRAMLKLGASLAFGCELELGHEGRHQFTVTWGENDG